MTARNDITGDLISSKETTDRYRDGWDRIFGKKEETTKQKWERMTNPQTVEDYAVTIPLKDLLEDPETREKVAPYLTGELPLK